MVTIGQSQDPLTGILTVLALRIDNPVGYLEIDRRQTCRLRITEPTRLHRGNPKPKELHAISHRMSGKVDQNIDLILLDESMHLVTGLAPHVAPLVAEPSNLRSGLIGIAHIAIAKDFESPFVMALKERDEKVADRMES
jgi:hypothetical protein